SGTAFDRNNPSDHIKTGITEKLLQNKQSLRSRHKQCAEHFINAPKRNILLLQGHTFLDEILGTLDDSQATYLPSKTQLQSVCRQPDTGGLCTPLHRQDRKSVVTGTGSHNSFGSNFISCAGGYRRGHYASLWIQ